MVAAGARIAKSRRGALSVGGGEQINSKSLTQVLLCFGADSERRRGVVRARCVRRVCTPTGGWQLSAARCRPISQA